MRPTDTVIQPHEGSTGPHREQSRDTASKESVYHNIESHPMYGKVCMIYSNLSRGAMIPTYAKKRHIAMLLQLPISVVSAIILDNFGID